MRFYSVRAMQGTQFYDGEWHPYPRDLYALYTGGKRPERLHVRVRTGTKPGDMIFATWNVVSEQFLALLRKHQATGFETFPVPLYKKGVEVGRFFGLIVHGRGGPFDPARSNADIRDECVQGYSAVYMDETRWDGSDVFLIPGLGIGLYVVDRIGNAIRNAKLRNVSVTANSDCRLLR